MAPRTRGAPAPSRGKDCGPPDALSGAGRATVLDGIAAGARTCLDGIAAAAERDPNGRDRANEPHPVATDPGSYLQPQRAQVLGPHGARRRNRARVRHLPGLPAVLQPVSVISGALRSDR